MNSDTYNDILNDPQKLDQTHISDLRTLVHKYPYFQSARALYLKGLKNADSFRYNFELKVTAAHTTDRTILFDYITSKKFQEIELTSEIPKEISNETSPDNQNEEEIALEVGKPIDFSVKEKHSFNQWLQLSAKNPIKRKESKKATHQDLIDKFIEKNPKITAVKKEQEIEISIPESKADKSLMTETLAKVYLNQKKYSKAIKAYKILSLKYPEKSGFFADQIKRIKILKQEKS